MYKFTLLMLSHPQSLIHLYIYLNWQNVQSHPSFMSILYAISSRKRKKNNNPFLHQFIILSGVWYCSLPLILAHLEVKVISHSSLETFQNFHINIMFLIFAFFVQDKGGENKTSNEADGWHGIISNKLIFTYKH